jgi:hypothetical protein
MADQQIHNLNEIQYNISVLRKMIDCMDEDENCNACVALLNSQCDKIDESIVKNQNMIIKSFVGLLEDLSLDIKFLEFENYATKNEHKQLYDLIRKIIE